LIAAAPHRPSSHKIRQSRIADEELFSASGGHQFNFRATPTPHWNGVVDCLG
jgi:hypothetical protein